MQLGFTENEAKVYLMLIRIGPSPVSSLARRIGMKRVTVYSVLDSLGSRGLVTFEQTDSCRKYIPHDPECLMFGLEKQSAELKYRMSLAKTCIEGMYQHVDTEPLNENNICFFSGVDAVFKALQERVDEDSTLFVVFPGFASSASLSKRLEKFLLSRWDGKGSLQLMVPNELRDMAVNLFHGAICTGFNARSSFNANLLVQKGRVFFVMSNQRGVRMLALNSSTYAKFFLEIVMPILKA